MRGTKCRGNLTGRGKESGYLLLPVAVAIALIGVIAFFIANQSAVEVSATAGEFEATQADYVAQAGLQHGLREVAQQGCGPYTDLSNVALGNDKYGTSLTTTLGSTTPHVISVDQDGWIRNDFPDQDHAKDTKLHIRYESGNIERPVYRYDLSKIPPKAAILSATAWFYVNKDFVEGPVDVHALNLDWTDSSATWDLLGDRMDPNPLATMPAQPAGTWVSVNLTSQVQAWVNGIVNYGIALNSTSEGTYGEFGSVESANAPYMELVVGTPANSPAKLKAVGTHQSGVSRTLLRAVTLIQRSEFIQLQPDGSAVMDTYLDQSNPGYNNGASDVLWIERASGANDDHALLGFALGKIPFGARIENATLQLYQNHGATPGGEVSIFRMRRDWEEGNDSFSNGPGATWSNATTAETWSVGGGESDLAAIATTTINPSTTGYFDWDVTPLVQSWISGETVNHGMMIKAVTSGSLLRFVGSDHGTAAQRPKLTITYSCQCGHVCLPPQGSGKIVLIGDWGGATPDQRDLEKEAIIESWGYEIEQWDDDFIWAIDFNNYDLVYVSETARAGDVSGQIEWRSIGIVNEEGDLLDNLGFAAGEGFSVGSTMDVVDNSHYITAPFATGPLPVFDGDMEFLHGSGTKGSGMQALATADGADSLMLLDTGATGLNGPAAGRRVALPLGRANGADFNWTYLNANGRLLVQRSIEWAMGGGAVPTIGNLLLVVDNDGGLTSQELAKQALFESWGYAVSVIDSGDSQTEFATAAAANDVVYIGEDINSGDLGSKLVDVTTGVVIEENNLADEFGFSDGINWGSGTDLKMERNHYITYTLPATASTILTATESLANLTGSQAPDIQLIGFNGIGPSLAALESGASVIQGRTAAGRRVFVPWGGNDMDINHLNDDGRTILLRSIEWAAGADIDMSPLAHWQLDETGGTTAVDSEGGHDGTLTNGPAWAAGMLDGGLLFDGINDAIVVPHDDTLSLTEDMTFTAWVRSDAFGVDGLYDLVVSKGTVATSYAYYFGTLGDEIIFGFSAGGTYREFTTPDLNLATGTWHHIAATFSNASNRVRLYHNGVEVLSASTTYEPSATTHDLYIGSSEDGADWDGVLDDVRIYPRALDATEISDLAERPGPLAHWKFDEGSGNTAVDSVGGHDATINAPAWDAGRDGGAIRVQSDVQSGAAPHDPTLNLTRGLTLMAWVSKANLSGYDTAIDKASSGSDVNYYLGVWFDEIVFGFSTASDSWQGFYTSGVNLSTGAWDHIAATFDNAYDEVRIYRNGVQVGSFAAPFEPLTNNGNLWLGRSAINGELLSGKLDDARIYDRVLDPQEIADVYDGYGASFGGGVTYTELYQPWDATADDVWQTVNLSSFGVPAGAVVEVAVYNDAGGNERWGGVRAVGSTLERRLQLHEAEQGGTDAVTMHVQADSSSQIQHYSDNDSDVRFVLLGYWTGAAYVEAFSSFKAGDPNSWEEVELDDRGVPADAVVEIAMINKNTGAERLAGARAVDSSYQRRFDLQESENGGVDALTLMVQTDDDSAAEFYAENDGNIDFYLLGHWSTPPGAYTERGGVHGQATVAGTWHTADPSAWGVPSESVAQFVMSNENGSNESWMGIRTTGSSLNRRLDLHEPESGGSDTASMHVLIDAATRMEIYSEQSGGERLFHPVGWWVLP